MAGLHIVELLTGLDNPPLEEIQERPKDNSIVLFQWQRARNTYESLVIDLQ